MLWESVHLHWVNGKLQLIGCIKWFNKSEATTEIYEWVQVQIHVYIPYCKHQAKPHSSPWFSAASAVPIAHRNLFFCLYQQNKSSPSKVKVR